MGQKKPIRQLSRVSPTLATPVTLHAGTPPPEWCHWKPPTKHRHNWPKPGGLLARANLLSRLVVPPAKSARFIPVQQISRAIFHEMAR